MGNVYAQLVILSMKNSGSIPKLLQKYTVNDGYYYYVQLRGNQVTAAEIDTIADLVKYSKIKSVYISPFENDLVSTNQAQLFRSLYERFPSGWDCSGYGAAVLDAYQNAMLYCDFFSEKAQTVPSKNPQPMKEAGWCIFCTAKDASSFVADFIRNGIKKDDCSDTQPIDPNLFQWLCSARGQDIKGPLRLCAHYSIGSQELFNRNTGTPCLAASGLWGLACNRQFAKAGEAGISSCLY